MPSINVDNLRTAFEEDLDGVASFVADFPILGTLTPSGHHHSLPIRRVELLAALALMRIHLAWEHFVESAFVRYLCGAKPSAGAPPKLLHPPKPTIGEAMTEILGKRNWVGWSHDETLTRANGSVTSCV